MALNKSLLSDVLIIGGGPAGLAVATGLARQLHTAIIFDSGVYRNARTQHMHNVVGWDHRNPSEFRAAGRRDLLARYSTVQFQDTSIESVRRMSGEKSLFEAVDGTGKRWYGRKVVLATGVKDVPLDIEGYTECWMGGGIFHCLFCDGYEEHGQKTAGFLAIGPFATVPLILHQSRMARRLTESLTIYTGGNEELAAELKDAVTDPHVEINSQHIVRLEKVADRTKVLVHLEDQRLPTEQGFLVHTPAAKVNGPFVEQLSLKTTPTGDIEVTQPFPETSMSGVFAVGDSASPMKAVVMALYSGTLAAAGLVAQLQAEL